MLDENTSNREQYDELKTRELTLLQSKVFDKFDQDEIVNTSSPKLFLII